MVSDKFLQNVDKDFLDLSGHHCACLVFLADFLELSIVLQEEGKVVVRNVDF